MCKECLGKAYVTQVLACRQLRPKARKASQIREGHAAYVQPFSRGFPFVIGIRTVQNLGTLCQ
eukprot:1825919-Rhodomonas_salina.2